MQSMTAGPPRDAAKTASGSMPRSWFRAATAHQGPRQKGFCRGRRWAPDHSDLIRQRADDTGSSKPRNRATAVVPLVSFRSGRCRRAHWAPSNRRPPTCRHFIRSCAVWFLPNSLAAARKNRNTAGQRDRSREPPKNPLKPIQNQALDLDEWPPPSSWGFSDYVQI